MKAAVLALTVLALGAPHHDADADVDAADPPRFSLDLVRADAGQLPALHSYALAESKGKWLVVGGRTNGLHLFVTSSDGGQTPPPNAFPPANANRMVWVIDPVAVRAWSSPVQNLPAPIADHLSATNVQDYQDGNVLYLIGGYGLDSRSGRMTTLPYTTAIKVEEAIQAVVNGQPLGPYIQQTSTYVDCPQFGTNTQNACLQQSSGQCPTGPGWEDCMKKVQAQCRSNGNASQAKCMALVMSGSSATFPTNDGYYARVTGGGLQKVGGVFYLVFGQLFDGLYSVDEGDYGKWPVNQVYTQRVAALALKPDPLAAGLLKIIQQDPGDESMPYHRRDLNVFSSLTPADGSPRVAAHGGVFVPGQDAAYRNPVFIDGGADPNTVQVRVDASYSQAMSQYDCATLRLFDRKGGGGDMSLGFFGGISLYYLDAKTRTLKMDSGLPFVDDLSVLTQHADGTWSEFVRSRPLDALMGTDAHFVRSPAVSASESGVIYLDALSTRTLVGYVYGGILAAAPQTNGDPNLSRASGALYQVWLTPTAPAAGYWVPATRTSTPAPPTKPAGE